MTPPPAPRRINLDDLPPSLANRLQDALNKTLDRPEVQDALDGLDHPGETPEEAQARLQARQAVYQQRWLARRPLMYADASPADLDHGPARDWLNSASLTLVLAGQVGTGKTHTAYAIGNSGAAQGAWVEAWTVTDLLAALRPDGDARVAVDVRRCDLLILDDLGASKPTEWAVDQVTSLLDARLREGRRQIVTTNAPGAALEEAWGGRLMDRLAYRQTVQVFTGESRRRTW